MAGGNVSASFNVRSTFRNEASKGLADYAKSIGSLNEPMEKVRNATMLMSDQFGQMGSDISLVVQRVIGLGKVLAIGGVLGVALTALPILIAGVAYAWEHYNKEARDALDISKKLQKQFQDEAKLAIERKRAADDLARMLTENLTREELEIKKKREHAEATYEQLLTIHAQRDRLIELAKAKQADLNYEIAFGMVSDRNRSKREKEIESLKLQIDNLGKKAKVTEANADELLREADFTELLNDRTEENAEATKQNNKAEKEREELIRATTKAIEDSQEAYRASLIEANKFEEEFTRLLNAELEARAQLEIEAAESRIERAAEFKKLQEDYLKDLAEQDQAFADQAVENTEQKLRAIDSMFGGISDSIANVLDQIVFSTETAGEKAKNIFLSLGRQALAAAVKFVAAEVMKQVAINYTASLIEAEFTKRNAQRAKSLVMNLTSNKLELASETATAQARETISNQVANMEISNELKAAIVKRATAKAGIAADTGKAVSSTMAANAGLPFGIGIAIGLAVIGTMIAIIAQYAKFAQGGLVSGGIPGRDSVPALLTPGELVLPTDMSARLLQIAGRQGSAPSAQAQAQQPIVEQRVIVEMNLHSLVPPTDAQMYRAGREFARVLTDLQRRGIS